MSKIKKKDLIENSVFSVYLEGIGYTIAQLRDDCQMEFFDILRARDEWGGVDLNEEKVLFCIVVAAHRLLALFHRNITSEVIFNERARCLVGLGYSSVRESTGVFGLNLIEYGDVFDPNNIRVLIKNLDPVFHKDILCSFELLGMNGKVDEIKERLVRYFSEGVNFDAQIKFLYPELELPPKEYVRKDVEDIKSFLNH
ncbi:hypothetical protein LF929_013855 [Dickeya oryzae]|uniref:Uncharacterized protein n=1 Tax=Dickeya oryzae TaxID=1240404 RepID=A0AB39IHW5_9GAMM|nr:hypothetical protein [Dickeya oryzae]MCA6992380.1 hypothetical protein [Dickeya oryzae]